MPLHYTLRLNVMTATPEYRDNAAGYMLSLSTWLYAKVSPGMDYPQSVIRLYKRC